jgi:CDP-6-deoxy-D-xylo-4-hexulose-3-dehydrase
MFNNIKLGNFGLMSSFSTYFGHTMSTIEGGIITTNDLEIYETLIKLRSHGWSRDLSNESKEKLNTLWDVDDFSSMYTFFVPGFNLRSTDLQAFIGINQLKKVDYFITKRNENFYKFKNFLSEKTWFPSETVGSFTSSFCIPIIVKNKEVKNNLVKNLIDNGIECRPLISGSMGTQPFYSEKYGKKILKNCDIVDNCGIYVPNHPNMSDSEIELICKIVLENI